MSTQNALRELYYDKSAGLSSFDKLWRKVKKKGYNFPRHAGTTWFLARLAARTGDPEIIEATGGGLVVEPGNSEALAEALETLVTDSDQRTALARSGQQQVRELYGPERMAAESLSLFNRFLAGD